MTIQRNNLCQAAKLTEAQQLGFLHPLTMRNLSAAMCSPVSSTCSTQDATAFDPATCLCSDQGMGDSFLLLETVSWN
jgi:hypothetical protein